MLMITQSVSYSVTLITSRASCDAKNHPYQSRASEKVHKGDLAHVSDKVLEHLRKLSVNDGNVFQSDLIHRQSSDRNFLP